MKVDNRTHWRTDHLRAFLSRVAADELEPQKRKRLRVEVRYNRQRDRGYCSGEAVVGGCWIKVMVPSQVVDRVDLAGVIAHEMAHARGMGHDRMRGCGRYRRVEGHRERYAWAESLPLERKPRAAAPSLEERRAGRREHALSMVRKWEAKRRLATTKLRLWTRRQYAVERTLALAAQQPGGAEQ